MTRVLIVDDNASNLYYLMALLGGHGFDVTCTKHGAEALVRARSHPPELIISDLLMPVMDGYTLLRHWRADPLLAAIPFVVYTATYTEPEDEQLAYSLGADAFILKPCEPDDFLAQIRAILGGKRHTPEGASPDGSDSSPVLEAYSRALIRKLEEKSLQLESSNDALRREIEERKQTEETLRESEERFRQLAENIDEVFWVTTVDHTETLYVSPAFERIWGRPREEVYRSPSTWSDAVHPDDAEELHRSTRDSQDRGQYDRRYRIVRPDGETRWIRDRAFPVKNATGAVYRIVGIAEDITERTRIEGQLLRSQRMESLGTLAGGIAHDLNNCLTPILLSIDLLRETDQDPTRLAILEQVAQSAQQGADMVRQVLSFARGVEGRRIAVSLPSIVRGVERIANDTFLKSIVVTSNIAPSVSAVLGDPTQLHQVLLNLCVNARDAMPDGGTLVLSVAEEIITRRDVHPGTDAKAGSYVVLRVKDSGSGMTQPVLDRIFDPFFTTKPLGKGTGLGLSTSLAIVRSHEGFIRVHSEPGSGSEFAVYLPTYTPSPTVVDVSSSERTTATIARGQREGILIVDDEPQIRDVLGRALEAFGYRVRVAADGREGSTLYAAHAQDIDLIVADMMMPIMDGPAMIRAIRDLNAEVPIVAMSGLADADAARRLEGLGVAELLTKPFTTDALLELLARELAGRRTN